MQITTRCYLIAIVLLALMMPECREREFDDRAPAQPRDRLMLSELMGSAYQGPAPIDNRYFMPLGTWEAARHEFEGTLIVPEFIMSSSEEKRDSPAPWEYFPGFSLDFFRHGKYLVAALRETIHQFSDRSYWRIIISPGTVWFEPEDGGMSFFPTEIIPGGRARSLATTPSIPLFCLRPWTAS